MKAITLIQPWATLMARNLKRYETRSWNTRFRGEVVIHSSSRFPQWARQFAREIGLDPDTLPLGALVARGNLIDVVRTESVRDYITAKERLYGDYRDGRFAFKMDNTVELPRPIPCKGALGLWDLDERILEEGGGERQ